MSSTTISDELLAQASKLPSATLHEAAGRTGALPGAITPVRYGMSVVGRAYPVSGPGGDNLWLHHAIYECNPGDVLIASVGNDYEYGYWGEVLAVAAQARGISGLVIDGGVRDGAQMNDRAFPVFSRGICIRGTVKNPEGHGTLGLPVAIGNIVVARGDLVVGDDDGVVVIPASRVAEVVDEGLAREDKEADVFRRLSAGERSVDIYGMPTVTS